MMMLGLLLLVVRFVVVFLTKVMLSAKLMNGSRFLLVMMAVLMTLMTTVSAPMLRKAWVWVTMWRVTIVIFFIRAIIMLFSPS